MRSSVDFPQPEGPTSTQNCASAISTSTPCTTSVDAYDLRTFSIETDAKRHSRSEAARNGTEEVPKKNGR